MTTNIDDFLEQEPETWKPKVGDTVKGTIVRVSQRTSEFGPYPLLSINTGNGIVEVHCFHSVLKNEVKEQRAQVGDRIGIKHLGKTKGKDYHGYRVIVDREPGAPEPSAVLTEPF